MKLLRQCPSAVWVARPEGGIHNIAVASDFSSVSDSALEAAVVLARCAESQIHLVNSVDYPLDRLWVTGLPNMPKRKHNDSIRSRAEAGLRKQLSRVDTAGLPKAVETYVVEGLSNPDTAILDFVKRQNIDLLALGTVGRSGIPGFFIGNTAERLLPQLACSVLAVKPAEFHCPVTQT